MYRRHERTYLQTLAGSQGKNNKSVVQRAFGRGIHPTSLAMASRLPAGRVAGHAALFDPYYTPAAAWVTPFGVISLSGVASFNSVTAVSSGELTSSDMIAQMLPAVK